MGLGIWEILLLAAVVALLFGSGKLPRLLGDLARGARQFRDDLTQGAGTGGAGTGGAALAEDAAAPKSIAALPRPDQAHRSQPARS